MNAVLALRPRALGDVVLTLPSLAALRRGHPDARLDVVTDRRYADLVRCVPGVSEVLDAPRDAFGTCRLAAGLRRRGYGVAVDFFGNPRTAFLTWASGARLTVGWDLRGRRYAYRTRVPRHAVCPDAPREYAADTQLRLAAAAGGVTGETPRLALPPHAIATAQQLLGEARVSKPSRAIGLVAAGTWASKTLPLSHVAGFARRLVEAGREVLLLSGPGEERVSTGLGRLVPEIVELPPCGVVALAAVIARLGGVAGTDSGPRHLAVACDVPTFAWFGPTHPDNWTPHGAAAERHAYWRSDLPCRACGRTACPHWNCMPSLDPDRVAERALAHFARHESSADQRAAARA